MGQGQRSDAISILTLTATAVAQPTGTGSGFDLTGFNAAVFTSNTAIFGGGWQPSFFFSEDGGVTWTALPVTMVAAPAAVGANGVAVYPWLLPTFAFPGRVRVGYTITSTAVTAVVRVIGRS
jgi:hypothetical protein